METCLESARKWLETSGFGEIESCFIQKYDGMAVVNFAAVQNHVLLYPDQVKVQVSMETGKVVGAECSQYLMNHTERTMLDPVVSEEDAREMLSNRLDVDASRLCVIPIDEGEKLCWEFQGRFAGARYYAYVDAINGEAEKILRVEQTPDGETAI